ncbi:uncharacterized protein TNCV_684571 [Trichonephila clavipes]|nr:uncharacterized protein TNCV_684571 [Trichonephila clavipes]
MVALKLRRTPLRTVFTKAVNHLQEIIENDPVDKNAVETAFEMLDAKSVKLKKIDEDILELMIETNYTQEAFNIEFEAIEGYTEKMIAWQVLLAVFWRIDGLAAIPQPVQENSHEDESIDGDKFQYLIQATTPKSRARDIVESFPAIPENYRKAFEYLRMRFGQEDVLIQVYVRELLKLVLQNTEVKVNLSSLYDKIEAQLRALESLGVTKEKYADMLFPLVESCLPAEILRAWERYVGYSSDESGKKDLDSLMKFLSIEVSSEDRIKLARNSFDSEKSNKKKLGNLSTTATAADLFNSNFKNRKDIKFKNNNNNCIFCEKTHTSENCCEAASMLYEVKKNAVIKRDISGRYEVALPWVLDNKLLSSNRKLAENRLESTKRKLIATGKFEEYQDVLDLSLSGKIIEEINDDKENFVHYLPHRPVIKENSTSKIRPVFDAVGKPTFDNFETMVLGLIWNLKDDCLSCNINCQKNKGKAITKRSLLSIANHIFDPIGFTAPVTLKSKLILQEIWKLKLKWDENLPKDILNQVKKWSEQLPILASIKIPRCLNLSSNGIKRLTLHVFCDASKKAYAACVFLRVEYEENAFVKLIQAKARVAPLRDISIPRLELLACVLGTRHAATVKNDLNLPNVRIYYLTDSMTALA